MMLAPLFTFLVFLTLAFRVEGSSSGYFSFGGPGTSAALTLKGGNEGGMGSPKKYEIVKEALLYSRWRTLTSRQIRFPDGRVVDFDVVGQVGTNQAVLIFVWDSRNKTTTIIQEYMPGANAMKFGVAAGLVEDKHRAEGNDPALTAAKYELEEEARLVGGTWIQLTAGTNMDKYSTTVARVYLVLDPQQAINPKPLDEEEDITVFSGVTIPEIHKIIANGEMNAVGAYASLVAIQRLREMGEIQ